MLPLTPGWLLARGGAADVSSLVSALVGSRSALKADHGCGGFVLAVPLNRLYLGTVGLFLFRDLRGLAVGSRVGRFR